MYYLQSEEWVGPRDPQTARPDQYGKTIIITSTPGRMNMSRRSLIEGWLGTTNDWYRYAHGEYPTEDEAQAKAEELFGKLYDGDMDLDVNPEEGLLALYYDHERAADHTSAYEWCDSARADLLREMRNGKTPETLAAELDAEALLCTDGNPAGVILHGTEEYLRHLLDEAE